MTSWPAKETLYFVMCHMHLILQFRTQGLLRIVSGCTFETLYYAHIILFDVFRESVIIDSDYFPKKTTNLFIFIIQTQRVICEEEIESLNNNSD
jgi:hypothetical protein